MQETGSAGKDARKITASAPSESASRVPRVGIVQARMGSQRLPGKSLLTDGKGTTLLAHVLNRVALASTLDRRVVATSANPADDCLVREVPEGFHVQRGPEQDVLQRFLDACGDLVEAVVVRVCADNPFIDPRFIDELVEAHVREWESADYYSYKLSDGTPAILTSIGLFAESIRLSALRRAANETLSPGDREHVTRWLYTHPERFTCRFLPVPKFVEDAGIRLTVDTARDIECFRAIIAELEVRALSYPTAENLVAVLRERRDLLDIMAQEDGKHRKV